MQPCLTVVTDETCAKENLSFEEKNISESFQVGLIM